MRSILPESEAAACRGARTPSPRSRCSWARCAAFTRSTPSSYATSRTIRNDEEEDPLQRLLDTRAIARCDGGDACAVVRIGIGSVGRTDAGTVARAALEAAPH